MNKPDIKQNPHPKMRYEVTLTIQDAPGPFESVTGNMAYEVTNEQCTPFDKFIGIYSRPTTQYFPIVFERIGEHQYRGTIYLDLLQDGDYYDLGVCHWMMTFISTQLKVGEVTFTPSTSQKQIISQQPVTIYFPKSAYGDNSTKDMHYGGSAMSDTIAQYRDEFFPITLTAKESFQ